MIELNIEVKVSALIKQKNLEAVMMNSFQPSYEEIIPISNSKDLKHLHQTMDILGDPHETSLQSNECKKGSNESKFAAWKIPGNKCTNETKTKIVTAVLVFV